MDSNKAENLSISSTKDSIIWSKLATKTNPQEKSWGFFVESNKAKNLSISSTIDSIIRSE